MNKTNLKLKEKDCNVDLLDDTVRSTGETTKQVRAIINFFSEFIADTIHEGAFETVIVPDFGKFQPKIKEIQYKAQSKGIERGTTIEEANKKLQHNGTI